jgi:quercetin dioxygenase-like cupin family protein
LTILAERGKLARESQEKFDDGGPMKLVNLQEVAKFIGDKPYRELIFDSPNLRVLAFNFEPGQELPIHSHQADSEVAMLILEGEGEFTGAQEMPAKVGDLQIMPVTQPHGLKAHTRLRLLLLIAPTL